MAIARKRKSTRRPLKRPSYKKKRTTRPSVQRIVNAAINKNLETKTSNFSSTDGTEIFHNNFITLDSAPLTTGNGITDASTGQNNRIGDKISLRGLSMKFMLELNERYSDVTFRCMFVKCAKGDVPTRATLFNGLSGNKMIDTINSERYTVLAQKWVKLKAPNTGSDGVPQNFLDPPGSYGAVTDVPWLSRATKIVKMWIPGKKIVRSGILQYENQAAQCKFFDYHMLVYAYSNYSTSQDLVRVGRLNDYVRQIYFKDG